MICFSGIGRPVRELTAALATSSLKSRSPSVIFAPCSESSRKRSSNFVTSASWFARTASSASRARENRATIS